MGAVYEYSNGRRTERESLRAVFRAVAVVDYRFRTGDDMTTYIEQDCTIEHEGRKFESGGAVVTHVP